MGNQSELRNRLATRGPVYKGFQPATQLLKPQLEVGDIVIGHQKHCAEWRPWNGQWPDTRGQLPEGVFGKSRVSWRSL